MDEWKAFGDAGDSKTPNDEPRSGIQLTDDFSVKIFSWKTMVGQEKYPGLETLVKIRLTPSHGSN